MPHFRIPTFLLTLLGVFCLLFVTADVTVAQSDPSVSINDIAVNELDSDFFGYEFEIRLSAPSTKTVSVTVTTQSGTATGDVDFVAGFIVLNFPAGQTSQLLTVFIKGDTVVEGPEDFFLNLSNPFNATIGDGQGKGTIIDDDTFLLLTQTGSQRAAALDSVFLTRESFPIVNNMTFFSAENRTRVAVFAIGLKLAANETASAVTATAEDSVGTIRPLTVEFVGRVPGNTWLTEVVLKMNDQITTAGDLKIKLSLHGTATNTVLVAVTP
jgi:hypothetical protein